MTESEGLIDSNILVYSIDQLENEKRAIAKGLIREMVLSQGGVVSTQNMAEFHQVVTKKIEQPIQWFLSESMVRKLSGSLKVISYQTSTILTAIQLEQEYHIHFFDALLAATMKENHISTIYTEDTKYFNKIPGIKAVNPFAKSGKK